MTAAAGGGEGTGGMRLTPSSEEAALASAGIWGKVLPGDRRVLPSAARVCAKLHRGGWADGGRPRRCRANVWRQSQSVRKRIAGRSRWWG